MPVSHGGYICLMCGIAGAECLFPEAHVRVAYTSLSQITPARLRAALVPCCCSPSSRLSAMKLLRELALQSSADLQTSLSLIKQLHLPDEDPALHDGMPLHAIRCISRYAFCCACSGYELYLLQQPQLRRMSHFACSILCCDMPG